MTETQSIREKCIASLASDVCPACDKTKKRRQSFCLKCYRRLPRDVQKALYDADGYEHTWFGAMQALRVKL